MNPNVCEFDEYGHIATCKCSFCRLEQLLTLRIYDFIIRNRTILSKKRECTICGEHLGYGKGKMIAHKKIHSY